MSVYCQNEFCGGQTLEKMYGIHLYARNELDIKIKGGAVFLNKNAHSVTDITLMRSKFYTIHLYWIPLAINDGQFEIQDGCRGSGWKQMSSNGNNLI